MGMGRPLTFGPDEMTALKHMVLEGRYQTHPGGSYHFHADMAQRYMDDLASRAPFKRKIKAVVAGGNGTAGALRPGAGAAGLEIAPINVDLDYNFPNHNPNPEDLKMLHAICDAVKASGADVGLAFDGDGDCAAWSTTRATRFSPTRWA